jgi:plasmid replication initiation protein
VSIWDADVLIWASSTLNALRNSGCNDLPRTLNFQAYDVLKTIGRDTGGRDYQLLRDALGRLQATTIKTNIRPKGRKKERQFSWIESWSDLVDENTSKSLGMSLTVSDWFYEGILMDGGLLAIDPLYFSISGGRERWLYRVARKHAGAAGAEASPFRCRPCSRNQARRALTVASSSRCWRSSIATKFLISISGSRWGGWSPPSA